LLANLTSLFQITTRDKALFMLDHTRGDKKLCDSVTNRRQNSLRSWSRRPDMTLMFCNTADRCITCDATCLVAFIETNVIESILHGGRGLYHIMHCDRRFLLSLKGVIKRVSALRILDGP